MRRFIIDMASCTGCFACSVACKDRAGLADELDFLRVEKYEEGTFPETKLYFKIVHCFHCSDPPCLDECPVDAISKEENGLVNIDSEKCIGCGDCVQACPYDAIIMSNNDIAMKCDGCVDEVAKGLQPACVRACPMRALDYGILEEIDLKNRSRLFDDNWEIMPNVIYLQRK